MEIVKLDPSKKKHAVDVLCTAFFDYPEFDFYFPDPEKRKRCLPWYLGKVMNTALRYGEVYTTQEISGVAFILPPGHTKISQWEYVLCGFLPAPFVLGMQDFIRSQQGEEFIGDIHEKIMYGRPHYYLWGLVVDPAQKRKGIGTALLGQILAKADVEKKPIYLETHDEKNVAYYQKSGFYLATTSSIPKFDIPVWCMVREPL
ncbi:MAG: GNAT family N-acetyltransferase [Anaerolineaceae bacterium]|jgi:ribosomal protein S18 acetylase RimI-like enzyme